MAEDMILVEEARSRILERVEPTGVERMEAWRAVGLPLAEDVVTDIDLSPFAASAMDGYAVRSADLAAASEGEPVVLDVVGHEAAGAVFADEVLPGQTVRVMTGAPVPAGADAVVKYEVVGIVSGDGTVGSRVSFSAPARPGGNVREPGLEAPAGSAVMRAGEVLTAAGAGLAASAGHVEVAVRRRPRVAVISVGTELVAPSGAPGRGQIRDANSSALMAQALEAGAAPEFLGIVPDDEGLIARAVLDACDAFDLVVTSGGASAGDYDYVEALVAREGEVVFDRVSMKPGKAITFGIVRGTPFLGLSGNPAAAFMGFEMLARPAIRKMLGHGELARPVQRARALADVRKRQARRFFDRARVSRDPATGELVVERAHSQNSALLGTIHRANALLVVPDGLDGISAGDVAEVVRFDLPEGSVL